MKISVDQDILRSPLNGLLGSRANVRLLRVLSRDVGGPLGAAQAAELAGLTAVGARKALAHLVRTGFVARVGGGRAKQYALREGDPIVAALADLFRLEEERFDDCLHGLREVLAGIPEVRTAWVDTFPGEFGRPLELGAVVEAGALPWIQEEVRARLAPLEAKFDLVIEVGVFTQVDQPTVGEDAVLLAGVRPGDGGRREPSPRIHDGSRPGPERALHSEKDARALRVSKVIADLIQKDASMIQRAARHVDRITREGAGTAAKDLEEWRQILSTYTPERIGEFLVSRSSRADRLRQSSPFFAVLTPDEREVLMARLEARDDA